MLRRTVKRTRYIFGLMILSIIAYTYFYTINQPNTTSENNKFIREVSFYKTHSGKDVEFDISWNNLLKKSTAENRDNFLIEQVKPQGKNWIILTTGKKCVIDSIQYVYAPWLDTEEKRIKANPVEKEKKVTQVFVIIEPKEEINDYYKVTIKNIENNTGEKMDKEEYAIVKVVKFNDFIKR
ncbi:MAG: hypothetical protein H7263_05895 [Candidatus Sericytochromatia bacterium]|nr:hypothetical protein [Candidatus Sericytochromatia bacterium]